MKILCLGGLAPFFLAAFHGGGNTAFSQEQTGAPTAADRSGATSSLVFLDDGSIKEGDAVYAPPEPRDPAQPVTRDPVTGTPYEGYGEMPRGGEGREEVSVTSLERSGPGTLAAAVERVKDGGIIKFEVGGTIPIKETLWLRAQHVTIAGETAPSPGITLDGRESPTNYGFGLLAVRGEDIIIRHLRFRDASSGLVIAGGNRILVDHVSSGWMGSGAGAIKINSGKYVTVSWCLIAGALEAMRAHGVYTSLHHNYWIHNLRRSPMIMGPGALWFDYRNNVVVHWHQYAVRMRGNAVGNLINNYFSPGGGIEYQETAGPWYIRGNYEGESEVTRFKSADTPWGQPPVTTVPAKGLVAYVKQHVGARPLDNWDKAWLDGTKSGYRKVR